MSMLLTLQNSGYRHSTLGPNAIAHQKAVHTAEACGTSKFLPLQNVLLVSESTHSAFFPIYLSQSSCLSQLRNYLTHSLGLDPCHDFVKTWPLRIMNSRNRCSPLLVWIHSDIYSQSPLGSCVNCTPNRRFTLQKHAKLPCSCSSMLALQHSRYRQPTLGPNAIARQKGGSHRRSMRHIHVSASLVLMN